MMRESYFCARCESIYSNENVLEGEEAEEVISPSELNERENLLPDNTEETDGIEMQEYCQTCRLAIEDGPPPNQGGCCGRRNAGWKLRKLRLIFAIPIIILPLAILLAVFYTTHYEQHLNTTQVVHSAELPIPEHHVQLNTTEQYAQVVPTTEQDAQDKHSADLTTHEQDEHSTDLLTEEQDAQHELDAQDEQNEQYEERSNLLFRRHNHAFKKEAIVNPEIFMNNQEDIGEGTRDILEGLETNFVPPPAAYHTRAHKMKNLGHIRPKRGIERTLNPLMRDFQGNVSSDEIVWTVAAQPSDLNRERPVKIWGMQKNVTWASKQNITKKLQSTKTLHGSDTLNFTTSLDVSVELNNTKTLNGTEMQNVTLLNSTCANGTCGLNITRLLSMTKFLNSILNVLNASKTRNMTKLLNSTCANGTHSLNATTILNMTKFLNTLMKVLNGTYASNGAAALNATKTQNDACGNGTHGLNATSIQNVKNFLITLLNVLNATSASNGTDTLNETNAPNYQPPEMVNVSLILDASEIQRPKCRLNTTNELKSSALITAIEIMNATKLLSPTEVLKANGIISATELLDTSETFNTTEIGVTEASKEKEIPDTWTEDELFKDYPGYKRPYFKDPPTPEPLNLDHPESQYPDSSSQDDRSDDHLNRDYSKGEPQDSRPPDNKSDDSDDYTEEDEKFVQKMIKTLRIDMSKDDFPPDHREPVHHDDDNHDLDFLGTEDIDYEDEDNKLKDNPDDDPEFNSFWRYEGNKMSIRRAQAKMMKSNMDTTMNPCIDYYQYACGNWEKENPIPKDKGGYDTFEKLRESLDDVLRELLEVPVPRPEHEINTVDAMKKARFLYQSCMDTYTLEGRGLKPLLELLETLGGWPLLDPKWNETSFDWLQLTARLRLFNNDILIAEWVGPDIKNSDEYIIQIDQTSLGLPTREYYLSPANDIYLEAYKTFMVEIMKLLGIKEQIAIEGAEAIVQFETALAEITVSPEDRRNVTELYRRVSLGELRRLVPQIDWYRYLTIVLDRDVMVEEPLVVFTLSFFQNLVELLQTSQPRTIANYLFWRFVRHRVNNLDERFQDAKQNFYYTLFGREQSPPRWKNCVSQVNSNMGMAVGAMFVQKYFDETSKNDTLQMVEEIMYSFRQLLKRNKWIDQETKYLANVKVDSMLLRIGYPNFILDPDQLNLRYESIVISPTEYFENTLKILQHLTRAEQDRLGGPVNKTVWNTAPAVVNAYYSRNRNQIMFPAGILQPPFYHRFFPRALNYGGIGVVIGHELTHGFDDKGRLFDRNGNLHRWWLDDSIENFHDRAQCLIDQYSSYVVDDVNMNIDGISTQGENIADNGGVKQAFRAYKNWLRNHKDDPLPGMNKTNEELFFINFAQVWCGSMRPEAMRNKLKTAVHSPGKFRVIGTLSNSKDFARVYKCPVGSPMNPKIKCSVW